MRNETTNRRWLLASPWMAMLFLVGCEAPTNSRLNSPPQGASERPHPMAEQYTFMSDNAMLEDMTMSTVHFVPYQSELNSLGVRRLKRYASILEVYGGTLNYDGMEKDGKLRDGRMDRIKSFLVDAGIASDRFNVATGISGNMTMSGDEALKIRVATRLKAGGSLSEGGGPMALSGGNGK